MTPHRCVHIGSLALSLVLSLPAPLRAAVVYVSQGATGATHDGKSWSTAFRTLNDVVGAVNPGDEVWVARGAYSDQVTASAAVAVFGGFAGTETDRRQRNPRGNPTEVPGVFINAGTPGVIVNGFVVRGGCSIRSDFATLENNVISNSRTSGVIVEASSAWIVGNVISSSPVGITVSEKGTAVVSGNTIAGNGVGVFARIDSSMVLEGNTISANREGIDATLGVNTAFATLTFTNNIVVRNGRAGLRVRGFPYVYASHNNVFGNVEGDYIGIPDPTGQNGNLSVDPKLSHLLKDLHIQPDSPCRNAGDNDAVVSAFDTDGQARNGDGTVDIGADESDGTLWTPPPARILYVQPAGDDANDGTSWPQAVKTITAAVWKSRGGDEIWVAGGSYAERVMVPAGVALYGGFTGTETSRDQRNWTANVTTVDGGTASGTLGDSTFYIPGLNATVDGFTVRQGVAGVIADGNDFTLRNSVITQAPYAGLAIGGPGALVEGNTIINNPSYGVLVGYGPATFRRNVFADNLSDGVLVYDKGQAMLRDNVITGNRGSAIAVHTGGAAWLVNNTLAISGLGGWGVNISEATCFLYNNIIAYHAGPGVHLEGASSILTMARNDVFGNNVEYEGVPDSVHPADIHINPLFVSYDNKDFHLGGLTVVDMGDDAAVESDDRDMDGRDRLLGLHVDIGAYEYQTPGDAVMADVIRALRIAGGLLPTTPGDVARLNAAGSDAPQITLMDAARLGRKVAGLVENP